MLYDLASEPPEPGSLLESLFLILAKRKSEQEFLKTRVLVEAMLAPHVEGGNKVSDTFKDYADAMFPFLKSDRATKDKMVKKALEVWTSQGAMAVKPLWRAKEASKGWTSKLAKGAERVRQNEDARKAGRLKKI